MLENRIQERFEAWITMQWIQPRIDLDCTDIVAVAHQPMQFAFWRTTPSEKLKAAF